MNGLSKSAKVFGHVERKRKRMIDVQNMIYWLVVEPYPSEKYICSSVGMMKFPIYPIYGNIKNVPNHQPVYFPIINITNITKFPILMEKSSKCSKAPTSMVSTSGF